MGSGAWSRSAYATYSTTTNLMSKSVNDNFKTSIKDINTKFIPKEFNGGIRESRDSTDHPESNALIFGLDVTGSMAGMLDRAVKGVNDIITATYERNLINHPQIMFMGIGDIEMDRCPIQATQFESDIRMLEQLQEIYFEKGGGGNGYESYSLAWLIASRYTSMDCFEKRSVKGTIITIGDEPLNPVLYANNLKYHGIIAQADIFTKDLYDEVSEKFNVYHINVGNRDTKLWKEILGERFIETPVDRLIETITTVLGMINTTSATASVNIR